MNVGGQKQAEIRKRNTKAGTTVAAQQQRTKNRRNQEENLRKFDKTKKDTANARKRKEERKTRHKTRNNEKLLRKI